MSRIKFLDYECFLFVDKYSNGNTAIELADEEGTVAIATVNLADGNLPEDQAYIKDYSENEGMLQALKDAGIVKRVIGNKASGFVIFPLCELDMDKLDEYTYKEEK